MFNVEFQFHISVSVDQVIHITLHQPIYSMATHPVSHFPCTQLDTDVKKATFLTHIWELLFRIQNRTPHLKIPHCFSVHPYENSAKSLKSFTAGSSISIWIDSTLILESQVILKMTVIKTVLLHGPWNKNMDYIQQSVCSHTSIYSPYEHKRRNDATFSKCIYK